MENIILQKCSFVSSSAPLSAELLPGEIAVNAVDGTIFIKSATDAITGLMNYTIADGGEITAP